ncbi:MAG TPA: F0F1 ATP synthase subunit A [Fibrobacteria bacterium]|nr:F0F1 ATP synthase subunit A [Fibrobacteria bacterium]
MKAFRILPVIALLFAGASARAADLGEFVIHHIVNSKTWHPIPGLSGIELPTWRVFGVDMTPSVHVIMMFIAAALLLLLVIPSAKRKPGTPAPKGRFAHMVEAFVVFIRDEVVKPNLGEKHTRKWMPFFLTIFFFFLTLNVVGLIPGFATATSNINFTAAFAILVFVLFNAAGMRANGPGHYFLGLIPGGVPWWLLPLIVPIELVGLVTKTVALALRLFANMVAGHALIFSLLGLIIVFKSHFAAAPMIPFTLFIYLIEILVAFLQAYIFTLLASLFIGQAVHQEH